MSFPKKEGYNDLILRPHPRYQHLDSEWLTKNDIAISNPKEESSFDFIANIDFMISNESAIHLDASIMYCPTVLYNISNNQILDDYNFVKNNLVKLAENGNVLLNYIKNKNEIFPNKEVLQYYNASSYSHLEGNLGETIAMFLNMLCQNNENQFDTKYGFFKDSDSIHKIVNKN